jgi:hypothetical protein
MGMQACSRTFNPCFLNPDGHITNVLGEVIWKDQRFDDPVEACYWLSFVSPDAQFGTCYIETDESRRDCVFINCDGPDNHYVTFPRRRDVEAELNRWLLKNNLDPATRDVELLDAISESDLRAAYERRLFGGQ